MKVVREAELRIESPAQFGFLPAPWDRATLGPVRAVGPTRRALSRLSENPTHPARSMLLLVTGLLDWLRRPATDR
jgi:hypothetical protein